jgi:hypothetical protein
MKSLPTRTQIVTAAAVLLLLGGFTAAFAYTNSSSGSGQTAQLPMSSTSSTTTSVSPTATTTATSTSTVFKCPPNSTMCIRLCQTFFNLKLNPVPVPVASSAYDYGTGHALLNIRGNVASVQAYISRAQPFTQYSIALDVNGVTHQIATMVTNQNGNGEIVAQILLQNGVNAISVQVFDTTNFSSPTLVLESTTITLTIPPIASTTIVCPVISTSANATVNAGI